MWHGVYKKMRLLKYAYLVQVNLCQKLLFLHQLTHNITTDCSLNYKFNTWKFQAQTWREHVVYRNCVWHSEQFFVHNMFSPCSAKRIASDKDLPVIHNMYFTTYGKLNICRHLWISFSFHVQLCDQKQDK